MRILLFGATGMVGQGVLRECLLDPDVDELLAIGRAPTGKTHDKLKERVLADVADLSSIEGDLAGWDACLFCLGVSAAGMSEAEYRRLTFDLTLSVARTLARTSPAMTFIYVSGTGTDGTARGGTMWARVKGETENALLALPFAAAYMFRPAFIQPMHGVTSKTKLYRAAYAVMGPLFPLWKAVAPKYVSTSEQVGRAMVEVAKHGAAKKVLENDDLNAIAAALAPRGAT